MHGEEMMMGGCLNGLTPEQWAVREERRRQANLDCDMEGDACRRREQLLGRSVSNAAQVEPVQGESLSPSERKIKDWEKMYAVTYGRGLQDPFLLEILEQDE